MNNNRLIQTLKRQHEELVNIYQQNKNHKPTNTTTKIDREQQTNKLNHHDSQVQTDSTPIKNSKLISPKQQKSLVTPPTNSHIANTNGPLLATRNTTSTAFNSNSTSSTSVPRSSSTAVATTTVTSKTSTVTTKSTTIINATPPVPPPSSTLSSTIPHDVVDLTEEDEDETTNNRTTPAQRITATRQVNRDFICFFSLFFKFFSFLLFLSTEHIVYSTFDINNNFNSNNTSYSYSSS